jgi:hypothetical protein
MCPIGMHNRALGPYLMTNNRADCQGGKLERWQG